MSKVLQNRQNTAGVGELPTTFKPKAFKFTDNAFDLSVEDSGYCQIIDTATGITTPRVIETRFDKVTNVYTNTSIAAENQLGAKAGVRVINKVSDVLTILDDSDSTYRVDLPIEAHVVLTLPLCDLITEAVVQQQIADAVATLFVTDGTTVVSRILKEARGIVKPRM